VGRPAASVGLVYARVALAARANDAKRVRSPLTAALRFRRLAFPNHAAMGTCNPAAIPAVTSAIRTDVVGISISATFDTSGNVKEWTQTSQRVNVYEIRGGSYNNIENARTCAFNFTVGDTSFRFPTTGFRCCYYP
jgi:hypothetical protein